MGSESAPQESLWVVGSNSHGDERKGQLGPAVTVPMSGTHLKRDEGWDPTIKDASSVGSESAPHFYKFYCGVPTLHLSSGGSHS